MSHSSGLCRFPDGTIFHLEYNGTVDVMKPTLHLTFDAMTANWRKDDIATHTCSLPPEDVEIYTDYGGGFYWPGQACRHCHSLVGVPDAVRAC